MSTQYKCNELGFNNQVKLVILNVECMSFIIFVYENVLDLTFFVYEKCHIYLLAHVQLADQCPYHWRRRDVLAHQGSL